MLYPINTTSARNVQRNYRNVVDNVKKTKKPVIVISRNQPEVAIVDLDTFTELQGFAAIDRLRDRNADKNPDEVLKNVTKIVEEVRQKRYDAAKSSR